LLADLQDSSSFPREILHTIGGGKVRATMGIPMMSQGEVIGIIYLDSFQPGTFTPEQARRVQAFANQAAIAVVNVRLRQALSDRRTTLLWADQQPASNNE
jgi:GAF domain-containing protein